MSGEPWHDLLGKGGGVQQCVMSARLNFAIPTNIVMPALMVRGDDGNIGVGEVLDNRVKLMGHT